MVNRQLSAELTNMIMIQDPCTQKVLLQKRELSWAGVAFPGGHVEKGESFYCSALREVKEETGLIVSQLKFCGVVHWCNLDTNERYLVFLYKTTHFAGELLEHTEEGPNFWASIEDIPTMECSPHFLNYLSLFQKEQPGEFFATESEKEGKIQFIEVF